MSWLGTTVSFLDVRYAVTVISLQETADADTPPVYTLAPTDMVLVFRSAIRP